MNIKKQLNEHPYRTAFILNLLAGIFVFGWSILLNRGLFSLAGDFNVQQIPFAMHGAELIKSGQVGFDYAIDLGSGFIGGMAFYILGNPSFYLSLLLPSKFFMYAVGWFYLLKYALAGLTAFAWIRRHTEKPYAALIASLVYAFSGFSGEALLFYHFHDVVWLFPLLLLTLDQLLQEKKRGRFLLAVAANFFVCYFFIPGELIILFLYFLVRYAFPKIREGLRLLGRTLVEGALGAGIAVVLLYPAALFTMQNPRVSIDYHGSNSLVFSGERYLFMLKGILFPGEVMSDQSAVISSNFATCSLYLPMIGMTLVIAFFLLYKKHWLRKMLLLCLLFAVVPALNASFALFSSLYYRWYYMVILFMALASALVIDRWRVEDEALTGRGKTPVRKVIAKACLIYAALAAFFVLYLTLVPWSAKEPSKIFRPGYFAVGACVCFGGLIMTWLIMCVIRKHQRYLLCLFVWLFSIGTMLGTLISYQAASTQTASGLYDRIRTSEAFSFADPAYRWSSRENPEMLSHGYMATGNFCSTVSGSIFRFYEGLGLERSVKSPDAPAGLDELVSAKYSFETSADESRTPVKVIEGKETTYYVYERDDIAPIGFTYDTYLTHTEFTEANGDKAILMLKTLVVPDEAEEEVSELLAHYDPAYDGVADKAALSMISSGHKAEASKGFARDADGFSCVITADAPKYAFFSIPNDEGWSAEVNGEAAEILDSNGMMAVRIDAGVNEIRFCYVTPGLRRGGYVTGASVLLTAAYLAVCAMRKKRRCGIMKDAGMGSP